MLPALIQRDVHGPAILLRSPSFGIDPPPALFDTDRFLPPSISLVSLPSFSSLTDPRRIRVGSDRPALLLGVL